jgi:tRNA threonylcarbamoyladenosine biosynthesis protein TsaB
MALILNVDTATDHASLALCNEGKLLGMIKNPELRDHASWIHQAIHELLIKCGYSLQDLKAIAVTAGPGSYTGLRIGMATAKGLCYVLNIPLIAEDTLKVMAAAFLSQQPIGNRQEATSESVEALIAEGTNRSTAGDARSNNSNLKSESLNLNPLLVPMIDARRMEVYTAVYDVELNLLAAPSALILNVDSFNQWKERHRLICFGNGSMKFEAIAPHGQYEFRQVEYDASTLGALSHQEFIASRFANLAYAEPFYLKEFYSTGKK